MCSTHCRVGAVVAWSSLLCATTTAQAVQITPTYNGYVIALVAIGGFVVGVVVVSLLMCCCWKAAALRLQERERRMWETAPESTKDAAVLERLKDDADSLLKRKAKKGRPEGEHVSSPAS